MERELQRVREKEPRLYSNLVEEHVQWNIQVRRKMASLPRVARFEATPWMHSAGSNQVKVFTRPEWKEPDLALPIRTMHVMEQVLPPGSSNGRHRHYNEAIFYVIEGRGHEVHDGIRYDWQAGDVFTVPTYADHQHFNDDLQNPARLFFSANCNTYKSAAITIVDQLKLAPGSQLPAGAEGIHDPAGNLIGYRMPDGFELRLGLDQFWEERMKWARTSSLGRIVPKTTYDKYLPLVREEFEFTIKEPHVVKANSAPWEDTRMGRQKWLVHPGVRCGVRLYDVFLQEIPPGGRSGKHRHVSEEVHLILEGEGYDVHDGIRWDWQQEDVVCIPVGVVHQHFNVSQERPARFVALQSRLALLLGHGGIEHLEDAP